jgi:hypothetical protein
MKVSILYFYLFLSFFLFHRCGQVKSPIGPHNSIFSYPLKINNQWEYARSFTRFNIRPDSLVPDSFLTITSTHVIKVMRKETLRDSIETFVLKETLAEAIQTNHRESFYTNEIDGLYFHAYNEPGFVIPKVSKRNKICFKDFYFNSIQEITPYITKAITANRIVQDSLIYEIPPLISLKYPLEMGSEWIYRPTGKPWRIDKKIIGLERLEVPAGIFLCYKIQWLYDFNHDSEWDEDIVFYDFISEVGLLKRSITFLNIQVSSDPGYPPSLVFDATDESVITSFSL